MFSWIMKYEQHVTLRFYETVALEQFQQLCIHTIVNLNLQYGHVNVCFNPSCSVKYHIDKKNVQTPQTLENNSMLRFLEKDTLLIKERNQHIFNTPILQQCSACRLMQYCSRECQKQDWRRHKPFCIPAPQQTKSY